MSKNKLAGIYMITTIPTGKIYIGQSSDIDHRIKCHVWLATTDKPYFTKYKRAPIVYAMRECGIDNVKFEILASGGKYNDVDYRLAKELEYINKYRAFDPKIGYNIKSESPVYVRDTPRKQSKKERLKRSKPIFIYDNTDESVFLFLGGAKTLAEYLMKEHPSRVFSKDDTSHAVNRGIELMNRYTAVFAETEARHKILKKLTNRNIKRIKQYTKIVEYIDHVASEFGF